MGPVSWMPNQMGPEGPGQWTRGRRRLYDMLRNPLRDRAYTPPTGAVSAPHIGPNAFTHNGTLIEGMFKNPNWTWSRAAWTPSTALMAARWPAVKLGLKFELINIAMGIGNVGVGTIKTATQWGNASGLLEDYAAGGIYGFNAGAAEQAGQVLGGAIGGLVGAWFTPLSFIGPTAGSWVGSAIGAKIGKVTTEQWAYADARMKSRLIGGELDKRRIRFGVPFRDSQEAYTMRQLAVQEMAGSLLNARQYLANEASFFHR